MVCCFSQCIKKIQLFCFYSTLETIWIDMPENNRNLFSYKEFVTPRPPDFQNLFYLLYFQWYVSVINLIWFFCIASTMRTFVNLFWYPNFIQSLQCLEVVCSTSSQPRLFKQCLLANVDSFFWYFCLSSRIRHKVC